MATKWLGILYNEEHVGDTSDVGWTPGGDDWPAGRPTFIEGGDRVELVDPESGETVHAWDYWGGMWHVL